MNYFIYSFGLVTRQQLKEMDLIEEMPVDLIAINIFYSSVIYRKINQTYAYMHHRLQEGYSMKLTKHNLLSYTHCVA